MKKLDYNATVRACGYSYIIQGILNNFLPLLFITFRRMYSLNYEQISFLIFLNFGVQMLVDILSAKYVDKLGYRKSVILSMFLTFLGFLLLSVLPNLMSNHYFGIIIPVVIYAVGGGLIETVASPILQACPIDNKDARMSMLHSYYCWGHILTVLVSSVYFYVFGTSNWKWLALFWSLIPFAVMFLFFKVPILSLSDNGETMEHKKLVGMPIFWIFIVLMFCSGASEQGISQWISSFAEAGLGIDKTVGDIFGTTVFAFFMGCSRLIYAKFSKKINLVRFMIISGIMCAVMYITAAISSSPAFSLASCVLCGLTVGIMWPGIYNISQVAILGGGTGLFAYLALAGDIGCAGGPGLLGMVSSAFSDNLKIGILFASVFPIVFVIMMLILKKKIK